MKYGYGLLKLDAQTLYKLDATEFLEMVEGHLMWHEFSLDAVLNNFAWFTANQMLSTGNMKKGTDPNALRKGLYRSLEDIAEETEKTPAKVKQDAQAEKERLAKRFNLTLDTN